MLRRNPIPAQGYISRLVRKEKGLTFGHPIEKITGYSDRLKTTILRCLLERPSERPSLKELREIVKKEMERTRKWPRKDFDFVIDLDLKVLKEEAERRKEDEKQQERLQRRNAREREDKEDMVRMLAEAARKDTQVDLGRYDVEYEDEYDDDDGEDQVLSGEEEK